MLNLSMLLVAALMGYLLLDLADSAVLTKIRMSNYNSYYCRENGDFFSLNDDFAVLRSTLIKLWLIKK